MQPRCIHVPDTHAEWPVRVAIFPSKVMAYFHTENGSPVAARCRSASLTRREACSAFATNGDDDESLASPSTSTCGR
jgi:hypothetical protein